MHKEKISRIFFLIFCLWIVAVILPVRAGAIYDESLAQRTEFAPGEILVRYKEGQTPAELKDKAAERARQAQTAFGAIANRLEDIRTRARDEQPPEEVLAKIAQVEEELSVVKRERVVDTLFLVKSADEIPPGLFISRFRSLGNVERVQPNYYYQILATPNDPRFASGELWGMTIIQAEGAWDQSTGGRNILAAVVDAGIDPSHEDLAANMVEFRDFAGCSAYGTGHGTHVAGTVGAVGNNGEGVVGVNWEVGILGMNIDCDGANMPTSRIIQGMRYAVDRGAKVINFSLGGYGSDPDFAAEITRAVQQGAVVVAAAGNCGNVPPGQVTQDCPGGPNADNYFPANHPDVITVAATGPNDEWASYSNYGSVVDVAAPGGNPTVDRNGDGHLGSGDCIVAECILSTWPGQTTRYEDIAGTSMAAPHVTGLVALMLSKNSALSVREVKQIMYDTADDKGTVGRDNKFGHGRINAASALIAIAGGEPTATPVPTGGPTSAPQPTPTGCTPLGEPSNLAAGATLCAVSRGTTPVTFSWSAGTNAESFRMQVFSEPELSNMVVEKEIPAGAAAPTTQIDLASGSWYWRVRAENSCGSSDWKVYAYE